jgi:hypothetical protein
MFTGLKDLIEQDDIIKSDKYLWHSQTCFNCFYHPSSLVFRSDYWRNNLVDSLIKIQVPYGKKTLILGHSDQRVRLNSLLAGIMRGFNQVRAINASNFTSRLGSIPLGITNFSKDSSPFNILGDLQIMLEAADSTPRMNDYNGSFLVNFSASSNLKKRNRLLKILDNMEIKNLDPDYSRIGRLKFLKQVRKQSYVLCPEGNGVDTHRIWETLYLGGIPIILSSNVLNPLLSELPVLIIRDWRELYDKEFLEVKWYEMQTKKYNFEKLKASFWIKSFCSL